MQETIPSTLGTLKAFCTSRTEAIALEEQQLRDANMAFRAAIQKGLCSIEIQSATPMGVLLQVMCLNLVFHTEERAVDRVTAAYDQAEQMLDLIQRLFREGEH